MCFKVVIGDDDRGAGLDRLASASGAQPRSQTSRRRAVSAEAIFEGGLPFSGLGQRGGVLRTDAAGLTLRPPDGFAPTLVGDLGEQRRQ